MARCCFARTRQINVLAHNGGYLNILCENIFWRQNSDTLHKKYIFLYVSRAPLDFSSLKIKLHACVARNA